MTQRPHPAFRRLCASGAAAGRLHASMERAEQQLHRVAFDVGGLRLLDDGVLAPLTRAVRVGDALARVRTGPFEPEAPVDTASTDTWRRPSRLAAGAAQAREEPAADNGDAGTTRAMLARREGAAGGHARARDHDPSNAPRDRHAAPANTGRRHLGAVASGAPLSTRGTPFADASDAMLRDAKQAVARRLEGGVPQTGATPTLAGTRSRHDVLRTLSPRPRHRAEVGAANLRDLTASDVTPPLSAASTVSPLRIRASSPAVSDILDRVARESAAATNPATAPNRSSTDVAPATASQRGLATTLHEAVARASHRGPHRRASEALASLRTGMDERDSRPTSIDPNDQTGGGGGLRRLIARAGVTTLSARPPQADVERAEGTAGVVADRVEESALAQRLGRLLRREARRAGIDVDEADA